MCSQQLFWTTLGSLLGIIGFLLVLWGVGLIRRKITNKKIYLGIILFGVGLTLLVVNAPVFATPFTVLATLALAFAAFRTIKQTSEHEQRRRVFEDEKGNRDRKEHWLDEILKWVNDIDNATSKEIERGYFGLGGVEHKYKYNDDMMHIYEVDLVTSGELITLLRHALYIKTISAGIDVKLGEKVQETIKILGERYSLLNRRKEPELLSPSILLEQQRLALGYIKDESKSLDGLSIYWQIDVLLHRNLKILKGSIDELIKMTSEIKVTLLRPLTNL